MLNELEIPLGVFIVLDPGTIIYSNAGEKQRSFLKDQFLEGSTRERFNFVYVNLIAPTRAESFSTTSSTGYCHDFVLHLSLA